MWASDNVSSQQIKPVFINPCVFKIYSTVDSKFQSYRNYNVKLLDVMLFEAKVNLQREYQNKCLSE